jgi:hypothetical protein
MDRTSRLVCTSCAFMILFAVVIGGVLTAIDSTKSTSGDSDQAVRVIDEAIKEVQSTIATYNTAHSGSDNSKSNPLVEKQLYDQVFKLLEAKASIATRLASRTIPTETAFHFKEEPANSRTANSRETLRQTFAKMDIKGPDQFILDDQHGVPIRVMYWTDDSDFDATTAVKVRKTTANLDKSLAERDVALRGYYKDQAALQPPKDAEKEIKTASKGELPDPLFSK